MPPLSEFFGSLERFVAQLYPYRLPLGALALLAVLGAAILVRQRGLDVALARWAQAHRPAAAALAALTLALALPLGYYTLSPLWIRSALDEPSPLEVSAAPVGRSTPASAAPDAPALASQRVLRRGPLAGADAFHFGRGDVLLIETPDGTRTLRFEGLSVRNGPDLFVYLTPQPGSIANAVNLGALKATDGSFNYEVPPTVDAAALAHAVIWCRQFGVLFAAAPLEPGS